MVRNFKIRFFLMIALAFLLFPLATSCQKSEEELPSIFSNPSYGNKSSDLFFKQKELKKYSIEGKIVTTVLINSKPELVLIDTDKQTIENLPIGGEGNRAPSFSPDGKFIFFSSFTSETSVIKAFDIDKKSETTLVAGKEDRYDPQYFENGKLIYNVFPKNKNFYLAVYDMKNKKESELKIIVNGINYAERAAEPSYDRANDTLYFVNDLAFDGKPKPINIWAYDFRNKKLSRITKNETLKVITYKNNKISSPQFFDLSVSNFGNLLYLVRYIEQDSKDSSPYVKKIEVHAFNIKTGEDRVIAVENTSVRSPLQISKNYVLLLYPEYREILLVNMAKPHERKIFLSLIDLVGDSDYTLR